MIAFRLALALGYRHPNDLLDRLTCAEWCEWLAFFSLEPFGDERADLRAGIVASTISNRLRSKGEKALQPHEFMPYYTAPQQTPEEIQRALRTFLVGQHGNNRNDRDQPSSSD